MPIEYVLSGPRFHLMRPGPYPQMVFFFEEKFLLAQGVQLSVAVPTVPRGTLGGAYTAAPTRTCMLGIGAG